MDSWGGWGPGRGERGPGGEDRGGGGDAKEAVRVRLCSKTWLLLTSALRSMLAAADAHHEDFVMRITTESQPKLKKVARSGFVVFSTSAGCALPCRHPLCSWTVGYLQIVWHHNISLVFTSEVHSHKRWERKGKEVVYECSVTLAFHG